MKKTIPKWIRPAMGWTNERREWGSDFVNLFDHTIACDDLILSFPYGFSEEKIECFRSFCKVYGHNVRFYEKPSTYYPETNTIAIYPSIHDDYPFNEPYVSIMKYHIEKALNKRYPNANHKFILGEEINPLKTRRDILV